MTRTPPRVALINGAAGGLGRGLVSELRAQGWRVAAGWHRQGIPDQDGDVFPISLDVSDAASCAGAVARVLERWHRLDLLVNNAGIADDQLLLQMDEAAWDRVLDVNLKGAFLCSQAVLRTMMKQRDGHIINVASHVARTGRSGQANYAAAKAGLIGLTQSLAREMGARNLRVNAILPGVLATPMTAKLTPAQLAALCGENALGRTSTVEEVARFVAFLATTENISGQIFTLDSRIARWA